MFQSLKEYKLVTDVRTMMCDDDHTSSKWSCISLVLASDYIFQNIKKPSVC